MSEITLEQLANMKWTEIPGDTPMYRIMQAVGFPEPMIILKHLSKPTKNGKTPDLSKIVTFFWMSKEQIQETIDHIYDLAVHSESLRNYLMGHPALAMQLVKALKQVKEEPISTIVARNGNQWLLLLVDKDSWDEFMAETPLTLIQKVQSLITETDYLNMPLSEYWSKFEIGSTLEKGSIKTLADHYAELEAEEQRKKQMEAELKAAGLGELADLLKRFGGNL